MSVISVFIKKEKSISQKKLEMKDQLFPKIFFNLAIKVKAHNSQADVLFETLYTKVKTNTNWSFPILLIKQKL